jgi:hypothetical protein
VRAICSVARCRSGWRQRRFGAALRVDRRTIARPVEAFLLRGDLGVEPGETLVRVVPVHVADRGEVLRREVHEVGAPHAADADGRDVQQIARRGEAVPEHMPGNDRKPG